MSRLVSFCRLPRVERWLAFEALGWLGLARAAVLIFPFRWVASALGPRVTGPVPVREPLLELPPPAARAVAKAIARVRPHTPWNSNCLAQAVAGYAMLRRRHIRSTLCFGVMRNSKGELEAHAWLRSGGAVLTGGGGLSRYAVVAAFAGE